MKQQLRVFIAICMLGLLWQENVQAQVKYPVTINKLNITPSVFLSDYTSSSTTAGIEAGLRFTDYNEPSIDVYLQLTIQGIGISPLVSTARKLYTLIPGENKELRNEDFDQYFLPQNFLDKSSLSYSDQLPAGMYTFTLQVMEKSGKPISLPVSRQVNVQLVGVPEITSPSPSEKAFIKTNVQTIRFVWQQPAHTVLSTLTINYFLRIYEIEESEKDPLVTMQTAGKYRQVYESKVPISELYYDYGIADLPLLKPGKRYAYTIQAKEAMNRKYFVNDGISKVGWFYYGYPTGGNVSLIYPEDKQALNRKMDMFLQWKCNDNVVDNMQPVIYKMKMVEIEEFEDPKNALEERSATWEYETKEILNKDGGNVGLQKIGSEKRYAWQIKAFTDGVEVGKSKVQTFYSPPLIDEFIAGYGHMVEVSKITNADYKDFSGKGRVKITNEGKMIDVHFEHLKIQNRDGLIVLIEGEVKCDISGIMSPIELSPSEKVNDKALFYPDSIRIRAKDGMFLKGRVEWDYPFGTTAKDKSKVKFQPTWFGYNDSYRLSGTPIVEGEQGYNLLEPSKFIMKLDNESYAQIYKNQWEMIFSGQVFVPENVRGTENDAYNIVFNNLRQLHYNEIKDYKYENEIRLIVNAKMHLAPRRIIVDFSEEQSPLKFSDNLEWKGIYFENFDLRFFPEVDNGGQIKLTQEIFDNYTLSITDTCKSWIIGDGLHFLYASPIAKEGVVLFNTFPSKIDALRLNIQKSSVIQAQLKGSIQVPVISQKDRYSYSVPITNQGFQTGYLDKSLEGLSFVFNESSQDQRISAKVKRAVFADKNHLDMDLELEWEKIGVTFPDLQRFNAWGNYEIGFTSPKGVINLTHQAQGIVEKYKINVEQIGCGRMCNQYSFAVAASVVIDSDISGPKGAPKLNFYSIANNTLLTGDCDLPQQDIQTPQLVENEGNFPMNDDGFGEPGDDKTAQQVAEIERQKTEEVNAINNAYNSIHAGTSKLDLEKQNIGELNADPKDYLASKEMPEEEISTSEFTIQDMIEVLGIINEYKDFIGLKEEHAQMIDGWVGTLKELDSKAYAFNKLVEDFKSGAVVEWIIDIAVDALMAKLSEPAIKATDKAKKFINEEVTKLQEDAIKELDKLLDKGFDIVRTSTSSLAKTDNAKTDIENIIKTASISLKDEIHSSVDASVKKNFTGYFTNFIDTIVQARVIGFIDTEIRTNIKTLVLRNPSNISINKTTDNAQAMLNGLGEDIKGLINPKNLANMMLNTGKEAIQGINWEKIGADIITQVASKLAQTAIMEKGGELADKMLGGVAGGVLGAAMKNVDIDFNALKNGNFKDAIKFDPSHIVIISPVFDGEGYAQKLKDDPIYGDAFKAGINGTIKSPKEFTAYATFISGKAPEDKFNYWFVEFSCRDLGIPLAPTPLAFDGGTGRVYKHMSRETSESNYVPDNTNEFGAGVKAYFYDQQGTGALSAFDVEFELDILNKPGGGKGFRLSMLGNVMLANTIRDAKIIKNLAVGKTKITYSNIDNIFSANATVDLLTTPLICGGGEFNALITPKEWSVSIGTRQKPLYTSLLCRDNLKMEAWLSIDKKGIDLGLHQLVHIEARTPTLNLGFGKFNAYGRFHYEFGAEAVVYWKPLKVKDAAIYLDVAFAVGVGYDCGGIIGSGDLDILAVGFGGHLIYRSRTAEEMIQLAGKENWPNYTGSYSVFSGRLYGRVKVVGFGIDLDMEAKKEWFG